MSKNAVMPLEDYVAACDTIREKTGTTDLIKSGELPDKVDAVYEAGKNAEWNEFWDNFQQNNARRDYSMAFSGGGWTANNFKPKYDIISTRSDYMFNYTTLLAIDLAQTLDDLGIILDTSQSKYVQNMFCYSAITRIGVLNLTNAEIFSNMFVGSKIKTIDKIILNANGSQSLLNMFYLANNLEDLTFEGVIGQNGLNLKDCTKLTHDSLMNVINCLKNFNEVILENCPVTAWNAFELPTTHTLVEGEKYSLTYEGDNFEIQTAEATVTQIYNMNAGVNALGLEFNMPSYEAGSIPLIWIYNDNGKLMYDAYYYPTTNGKIKLTKISTETHTVTFGTTNLAKLTDAEKAIATQKGWTLL